MKKKFREIRLSAANKVRLQQINSIIGEYQQQGYKLTLRQLYYQLVSRDVIPNQQKEYSKLSKLLKEGRMAGVVDWDAIEDRLRNPYTPAAFSSPAEILQAAINQYQLPRQEGQKNYCEVWVEKDALSGVLKRVTSKYHVPILVNRGYSSASAMFDSYERFSAAIKRGQTITIFYLGDFDPSGLDMIRDIKERTLEFLLNDPETLTCDSIIEDAELMVPGDLPEKYRDVNEKTAKELFPLFAVNKRFSVAPLALTREQIRQYNPPPNPAKLTDPRAGEFVSNHGSTSWEVDALKPEVLNALLTTAIENKIDVAVYKKVVSRENADKKKLESLNEYL